MSSELPRYTEGYNETSLIARCSCNPSHRHHCLFAVFEINEFATHGHHAIGTNVCRSESVRPKRDQH